MQDDECLIKIKIEFKLSIAREKHVYFIGY